jgi:uncharacterized protein (DUF1501 family)
MSLMKRRQFLSALPLLVSAGTAISGISSDSPKSSTGRRLILIELAGANDGLNTVVPWRHDTYREARPTLALNKSQLISINDEVGLHRSLKALMPLAERGELACVQGLGYPLPNRSHFQSTDYWHTGGDGEQGTGRDGWITHDTEHRFAGANVHGISLVGDMGPLHSASGRWLSAASLGQLAALSIPDASLTGVPSGPEGAIGRIATRMRGVDGMLSSLSEQLARAPSVAAFPGGALGQQLREVTRFIAAGLETPIYRVQLTGFDTHANQRARQARLLNSLAQAVSHLRRELKDMNEWGNTLVMTHSEFGRRLTENESGGTDHGTAAPQFIAGGALGLRAPLLGTAPDLGTLVDHDPVATLDYRALYERVLSGWLDMPDNRFSHFRDPAVSSLFSAA